MLAPVLLGWAGWRGDGVLMVGASAHSQVGAALVAEAVRRASADCLFLYADPAELKRRQERGEAPALGRGLPVALEPPAPWVSGVLRPYRSYRGRLGSSQFTEPHAGSFHFEGRQITVMNEQQAHDARALLLSGLRGCRSSVVWDPTVWRRSRRDGERLGRLPEHLRKAGWPTEVIALDEEPSAYIQATLVVEGAQSGPRLHVFRLGGIRR